MNLRPLPTEAPTPRPLTDAEKKRLGYKAKPKAEQLDSLVAKFNKPERRRREESSTKTQNNGWSK